MLRRAFTTLRTRDHSGMVGSHKYLAGMVGSAAGAGGLYWATERDRQRRADLMREFEGRLAAARVQAQEETEARKAALEGKQTLWTGKLLAVDHRLQGHLRSTKRARVAYPHDQASHLWVRGGGRQPTNHTLVVNRTMVHGSCSMLHDRGALSWRLARAGRTIVGRDV
jgi:hypothetical protein